MKRSLYILCFLFAFAAKAQVLQPLGSGIPGKVVASYANGNEYLVLYDDVNTTELDDYSLARWNGLFWKYYPGLVAPDETKIAGLDYNFRCLAIYNGDVYAAANISKSSQLISKKLTHLYKWNGTNWAPVLGSVASNSEGIYSMTVWNGQLIVAGKFTDTLSGQTLSNIAAFNGSSWSQLGSSNSNEGTNGEILSLYPKGSRLYIGGSFNKFGGILTGNIAFYTDANNNWGGIGSPFVEPVHQLTSVNNSLFAISKDVNGEGEVREFINGNWNATLPFTNYTYAKPKTISGGINGLFVGGDFEFGGSYHSILSFNNGTYTPTFNRINGSFKLEQVGTNTYVWGNFKETNTDISYFSPLITNKGNATGIIFHDLNNNCIKETDEPLLSNVGLVFTDANNKQQFARTNSEGLYTTYLNPGLHTVDVTDEKNWKKVCTSGNFIFSTEGKYTFSNLAMTVKPNLIDLGVKSHQVSLNGNLAGAEQKAIIHITNYGSLTVNGATFSVKINPNLTAFNSYPIASNFNNNEATFSILNLEPRSTQDFVIYTTLPLSADSSTRYPLNIELGSLISNLDEDKSDNIDVILTGVNNEFDGVVKKTAISGSNLALNEKVIQYRIEYANASNKFVRRVVVIDSLDADYTIKKIEYTAHNPVIKNFGIVGERILVLDIPEANLSTKEASPAESSGYINFNIVLSKTPEKGTLLTNRATVNFDTKVEVSSNLTQIIVGNINTKNFTLGNFKLFPNPANTTIAIQNLTKNTQVQVLNLQGKTVLSQYLNLNDKLNISSLSIGTYVVQINNAHAIFQVIR